MADLTNPTSLPNGYKNGQQAPLDGKNYFANIADLRNVDDVAVGDRPLQWYKEMKAVDRSTGKEYVWRESETGLIVDGYTYAPAVSSFGFDYSNKKFNWIELYGMTIESIAQSIMSIGGANPIYKGFNLGTGKHEIHTLESNTLDVSYVDDKLKIEVTFPSESDVRDFFVDTRYGGDVELGTQAKPYKTLDNAIVDYIGTGTFDAPQFMGSRIYCLGGETHSFTSDLSIRNLILEVEAETIIIYNGVDDYMVDIDKIQTALGGYANQTGGIHVQLRGGGEIFSRKLLIRMAHSGHDRATHIQAEWFRNLVTVEDVELFSLYGENDFTVQGDVKRSDGSDWVVSGVVCRFYDGLLDKPAIICSGASTGTKDNSNQKPIRFINATIQSLTQVPIKMVNSVLTLDDCTISMERYTGYTVIQNGIITGGNLITEDPLLSYNLPTHRTDQFLVELEGNSDVFITGKFDHRGYGVGQGEAWFNITDDLAQLDITNAFDLATTGGTDFINFIKTGAFIPLININNWNQTKKLQSNTAGKLIDSTVIPYVRATVKNSVFPFEANDNIDLTKGNTVSVSNTFRDQIIESLESFAVAPVTPKGKKYKLTGDDKIYAVS